MIIYSKMATIDNDFFCILKCSNVKRCVLVLSLHANRVTAGPNSDGIVLVRPVLCEHLSTLISLQLVTSWSVTAFKREPPLPKVSISMSGSVSNSPCCQRQLVNRGVGENFLKWVSEVYFPSMEQCCEPKLRGIVEATFGTVMNCYLSHNWPTPRLATRFCIRT